MKEEFKAKNIRKTRYRLQQPLMPCCGCRQTGKNYGSIRRPWCFTR